MKLTKSQKHYLILLKNGNLFRVDEAEKNVRIRGYDLRIQYNTFRKFLEKNLIAHETKFYRPEQPHIKYYSITSEGVRQLEASF